MQRLIKLQGGPCPGEEYSLDADRTHFEVAARAPMNAPPAESVSGGYSRRCLYRVTSTELPGGRFIAEFVS